MHKKINLFLIGAQKSGTTALYDIIIQHPSIYFPDIKEILYFTNDKFYNQGLDYLDTYYRIDGDFEVIGLADPVIIAFPSAVERIYKYNPEAKIIVVLRNPIDRAYSAYWMAKSFGWEDLTFEQAIEENEIRLKGDYSKKCLAYLSMGNYSEQLTLWNNKLSKANVLVIFSDDLSQNTKATISRILTFLNIDENVFSFDVNKKSNTSFTPKNALLMKILMNFDAPYRQVIRNLVKPSIRKWVTKNITFRLVEKNMKSDKYPPMETTTREYLIDYYREGIHDLEDLYNKNLHHWLDK